MTKRPPTSVIGRADETPGSALQKRFGTNFRIVRKAIGLTQTQVATLSEIGQSDISAVERGQVNLTLRQMERLASAVDHDVSVLLVPRAKLPKPR